MRKKQRIACKCCSLPEGGAAGTRTQPATCLDITGTPTGLSPEFFMFNTFNIQTLHFWIEDVSTSKSEESQVLEEFSLEVCVNFRNTFC